MRLALSTSAKTSNWRISDCGSTAEPKANATAGSENVTVGFTPMHLKPFLRSSSQCSSGNRPSLMVSASTTPLPTSTTRASVPAACAHAAVLPARASAATTPVIAKVRMFLTISNPQKPA